MKNLKLGYYLANDYNSKAVFRLSEFTHSFLHGIGYNFGVIKVKLFGYNYKSY